MRTPKNLQLAGGLLVFVIFPILIFIQIRSGSSGYAIVSALPLFIGLVLWVTGRVQHEVKEWLFDDIPAGNYVPNDATTFVISGSCFTGFALVAYAAGASFWYAVLAGVVIGGLTSFGLNFFRGALRFMLGTNKNRGDGEQ